jgi:hypothetical protein
MRASATIPYHVNRLAIGSEPYFAGVISYAGYSEILV